MLCVVKYMNDLVFIRIRCIIKVQKWDINMFGNLVMEVAVSFETSVFLSDYTTSYPRSQRSSLLWGAAYTAGIAKTQPNLACSPSLIKTKQHKKNERSKTFRSWQPITLWRRNYFFLILAHPVYKMWIIQEPNKLALWNKLHFEEKKTEIIQHV